MPKTFVVLLLLMETAAVITGCSPEVSRTPGVSIRRDYSGNGGYWGADTSAHLKDSLAILAAESLPGVVVGRERIISLVDASDRYEVVLNLPKQEHELRLAEALRVTFGIQAVRTTHEIPVLLLVRTDQPLKLRPTTMPASPRDDFNGMIWIGGDPLFNLFQPYKPTIDTFTSFTMKNLAAWLESWGSKVVVDETGLQGAFDFTLTVDSRKHVSLDDVLHTLGLTLKPAVRNVKAVYIEPTPVPGAIRLRSLLPDYQKEGVGWNVTKD